MKEGPEGLCGQNVATHTIRLEMLSFCLQTSSLRRGQWGRHSSCLSSFLPSFLFLSLPPSLISRYWSRPWVLEDLRQTLWCGSASMVVEKCLMSLAMVQKTEVQMTSSCTFQRRAPLIILNLVKQYQGKLSRSEKKKKGKFQICWLKVTLLHWEFLVIWIQSDLVSCERKRTWVSTYYILGIEARFGDE